MAVASFKVQHETVTVPTAALLALAATPYELVPAPNSAFMIEFLEATVQLDYNSVAYAEDAGGSNLAIKYTDASGVQVSQDIEVTGFIDQTEDMVTCALFKKNVIVSKAGCAGQALVLHNIGAGELVTGDSPLVLDITYRLVTVL